MRYIAEVCGNVMIKYYPKDYTTESTYSRKENMFRYVSDDRWRAPDTGSFILRISQIVK